MFLMALLGMHHHSVMLLGPPHSIMFSSVIYSYLVQFMFSSDKQIIPDLRIGGDMTIVHHLESVHNDVDGGVGHDEEVADVSEDVQEKVDVWILIHWL